MACELDRTWTAQLRPLLIAVEQVEHGDVHDVRFDGIESRDEPLCRACACACVPWQERLAPFANVQYDRAAFEQYSPGFLERPAYAQIAHITLCETGNPAKSGNRDHWARSGT